jgi:hypothetical protein
MPSAHLSKSRYLASLQCDRRLWFDIHDRDSATPMSDATRHILDMGTEVGFAAHHLFPEGVLVDVPASEHALAIHQTRDLMADESVPAIFEAAFEHQSVRIRVDILERREGGRWGLREVKSSSGVKRAQHLPDVAVQRWVLEGCGLEVDSAELIHVNGRFVRGEAEIDWVDYFERVELLEELDGVEVAGVTGVAERIESMKRVVAETQPPLREPGAFCKKPHLCGYWEMCTAAKSASWRVAQTGANAKKKAHMIEITESGAPWFSEQLAKALEVAAPPVWALDFETIGPAIPFYPGTQPYKAMAFQWSLHRLAAEGEGEPEHFEFLADGPDDPQPEVARSLVEILGRDSSPVLVYSPYEKTCLRKLAKRVPELAGELEAIVDRLVDLYPIVKAHVYHPDLLGSFSIKKVGPAFAPAVTHADLEGVSDGTAAMGAFARIAGGEPDAAEKEAARQSLLAYCKMDTLALLELYRALAAAVN